MRGKNDDLFFANEDSKVGGDDLPKTDDQKPELPYKGLKSSCVGLLAVAISGLGFVLVYVFIHIRMPSPMCDPSSIQCVLNGTSQPINMDDFLSQAGILLTLLIQVIAGIGVLLIASHIVIAVINYVEEAFKR